MARALALARRGMYTTTPNPRVGCVIVKNHEVVGEGYHVSAGSAHAEVVALQKAGARSQGATVYVTLEPCAHHGRTPPCTEALVQARVAKVIAAMADPNPLVSGKGMAFLREADIEVLTGLMEAEARTLNAGFILRMTAQRPLVRLKIAASLDGRTALQNGVSQWITGEAARRDAHHWRARSCAVLTGINTVLSDDPQLTVRAIDTPRQPWRVVLDSGLRMPLTAKLLNQDKVLILTAQSQSQAAPEREESLAERGVEIARVPASATKLDLARVLEELARRGMNEVLVEAGASLNGAFLDANLVDEVVIFMAPCVLGNEARAMFNLPSLHEMTQRRNLEFFDVRQIGCDLRLILRPKNVYRAD